MELFDKARNMSLNEITILKVMITHEENIRNDFLDFVKNNPDLNIAGEINEDNVFEKIDQFLDIYRYRNSNDSNKEVSKKIIENINNFMTQENMLEDGVYKIGFNRRILSDLKPFCLSEDLAGSMVMKAKAPTISNTDFKNNLNIEQMFKKEQTFNQATFEILDQMKQPTMKVDSEGIQYMVSSPIKRYEELDGNEVVNGDIKISLHPVPIIRFNEYLRIEKDVNGNAIKSEKIGFKNSTSNKENVLKSIHESLSGIYVVEALAQSDFPITGKVLFTHKMDYAKLKEYQDYPKKMPSYSYSIDKNGVINLELDDIFLESYKEYITLDKNMKMSFGNSAATHTFNSIIDYASDAFNNEKFETEINSYRMAEDKAINLIKDVVNLEELFENNNIVEFDKKIFILQHLVEQYLKNELLNGIDEKQEKQINAVLSTLSEYVQNNEYLNDQKVKLAIKDEILIENSNEFFDSLATLKGSANNIKDYSSFNIEIPKLYRQAYLTKEAKLESAINKILDFAHKANHGSLRNDRTQERRVMENISRVEKELGISPNKFINIYLNKQINLLTKNVEVLKDITVGINENLDFQNRQELPIININEIPEVLKNGKRVISYDIETGGLKADVDGVSQFTAMVTDYNENGEKVKSYFVDEYTNPEQKPLPIIGKNENGYIFGDNGSMFSPGEIYGYKRPVNIHEITELNKVGCIDEVALTNSTYHIWRTENPQATMYDINGNHIKFLYPIQNIGAIETHGIQNEFLVEKPAFRDILPGIQKLMDSSNSIIGFNTEKFDNNFLIGLAKKNGLELKIEPSKNVDLKRFSGDIFSYSQVKNGVLSVYKNSEKLNLEHNERFSGKTLNALCMYFMNSLGARYVTGTEIHDAKADTAITHNLAKITYDYSNSMLPVFNKTKKEVEQGFDKINLKQYVDENSRDSELLFVLKTFKELEETTVFTINNLALVRQIELFSELNPTIGKQAEKLFNDNLIETKNKQKVKFGRKSNQDSIEMN